MTIRQIYYTSCQQGLDGIQGFQVNAVTPGIDRTQVDAGLQLSLYRPAPSAPPLPTPEQVQASPVAVGYRSYGDYAVLFHSRYLGADFTGRQGNYFAHILVLDAPDGDLAGMLPVQAWGANRWQWEPVDGTELPVLTEVPRGRLGEWSAGDHLRAGRLPEFGQLLSAVQDGLRRQSGRVVVVAPRDEDVARAIAAVTRSLPPALAAGVSFTTFTASPGDADVLVVGTSPDVAIPSSPFGDQTVLRLGSGPGTARDRGPDGRLNRYARVVEECWARGDDEAEEVVALAASIVPPIEPSELDELSYLVELVVADSPAAVPDLELLPALEFGVRRWPVVLRPRIWERVEYHLERGVMIDNVPRWSAVLTAAHAKDMTPLPGLEARYLNAALAAVTDDGLDPATIWLPARFDGPYEQVALHWASTTLDVSPSFETAAAVLGTLGRIGVGLPDPTLRHLADRVVLPQLIDPVTSATATVELRRLSSADRVLPLVCEQMEGRLGSDELFDAVVEELPVAAAGLLAPYAAGRSRSALAFAMVQARARSGDRDPVSVLAEALRFEGSEHSAPDAVERFVGLLWPELPPAAEAVALCRTVRPEVLGATTVPLRLVERLVADARNSGLRSDHSNLADELAAEPIFDSLGEGRPIVRAVRFGAYFHTKPRYSDRSVTVAADAVRSTGTVIPEIRRWVLEAVAGWILGLTDATQHAEVLHQVLTGGGTREFVDAYRQILIDVLRSGRPAAVAAVLPALAYLAIEHAEARSLLDITCVMVLTGRKKRDMDSIAQALGRNDRRLRPMLHEMGRKAPESWLAWWEKWQETHLRRSLVSRFIARRRTAKASD